MGTMKRAPSPEEVLAENARLRRLLAEQREEMIALAAALQRWRRGRLRGVDLEAGR
jgi:hypothetical protein